MSEQDFKKELLAEFLKANSDWTKLADVRLWPPGMLMVYDNRHILSPGAPGRHCGVGIVIANDGVQTIRVLWDAGCSEQYKSYDMDAGLNPAVIYRVE